MRKLHIIIVAHGSRNAVWTQMVEEWFAGVRVRVAAQNKTAAAQLKLSFLEHSRPPYDSILRGLDDAANDVRILPFFLTRSAHRVDDVPGQAYAALKKANWSIIEPDGLTERVGRNAARRLLDSGALPGDPVIVSVYGSPGRDEEWGGFVDEVRRASEEYSEGEWTFAPAGHFLADPSEPLRAQLTALRDSGHERAAVLPLYVSLSSYQEELIPAVLADQQFGGMQIAFQPTAILPDEELEEWAAATVLKAAE